MENNTFTCNVFLRNFLSLLIDWSTFIWILFLLKKNDCIMCKCICHSYVTSINNLQFMLCPCVFMFLWARYLCFESTLPLNWHSTSMVQHTLGTSLIFLFFSVSSISCILPSLLFMMLLSGWWNLSQLQQKVRTVKVIKSVLSLQPAVRLCNSLLTVCVWVCDL